MRAPCFIARWSFCCSTWSVCVSIDCAYVFSLKSLRQQTHFYNVMYSGTLCSCMVDKRRHGIYVAEKAVRAPSNAHAALRTTMLRWLSVPTRFDHSCVNSGQLGYSYDVIERAYQKFSPPLEGKQIRKPTSKQTNTTVIYAKSYTAELGTFAG